MSVILIGYRGSGKTSVGRKLAALLGQSFVDVDELIVQRAGKSIKEIFEQDGETKFRDIESDIVKDVSEMEDRVIALGGGTLGRQQNREALSRKRHRSVYLRCEPDELNRRCASDPKSAAHRPNLTHLGGGVEEIRKVLGEREPIYRQMAEFEIDVTKLSPDEVTEKILAALV